MDIRLQTLHFEARESLKAFVDEKVGKLFEHSKQIVHAEVTLYEDGNSSSKPKNQVCEIRLSVPGDDHFVKKDTQAFEQSILECVDTLQKVLRRQKEKLESQRHSS